jgi:hypothetical protein
MKITLVVLLFVVFCQQIHAEETNLTLTVNGVTYSNVTFVRATPYAVSVRHSTGIAAIPLSQLPPDLQQRFGYNPEKSAQYRKAEVDEAQRVRQADAEKVRQANLLNEQRAEAERQKPVLGPAIQVKATVIQAMPDGALVALKRAVPIVTERYSDGAIRRTEDDLGDAFILGLTSVYDGNAWSGTIAQSGDYTYTTIQGAYRKVPQYRLSQ